MQFLIASPFTERFTAVTSPQPSSRYLVGDVLPKGKTEITKFFLFHEELFTKAESLIVGECIAAVSVTAQANGTYKSARGTKIFSGACTLAYDEEVIANFAKPPVISFGDVKVSPKRKRISIEGVVREIGSVSTSGKKRKLLTLVDDSSVTLQVKLWEEMADLSITRNTRVKLFGVEVERGDHNGSEAVNSTSTSSIELVEATEKEIEATILAIDDGEVLTDAGSVYTITTDLRPQVGEIYTLTVSGDAIINFCC